MNWNITSQILSHVFFSVLISSPFYPPTIHPVIFHIHHFFSPAISSYVWMLTPQSEKQTEFFPREQIAGGS